MTSVGLDHINLAVPSAKLAELVRFYTEVIGLTDGDRPAFPFPGNWLYADGVDRAVIHLASYEEDDDTLAQQTGRFNHYCLNMTEPVQSVRSKLDAMGIEYREQNRPVNTVIQLFLKDPAGVMLELSFPKAA